ncbi:MAG TPA: hypothetical protein VN229_01895 [Terriglobales bacterium]|nr:hypothetical protein [Terriglobales bacterium]
MAVGAVLAALATASSGATTLTTAATAAALATTAGSGKSLGQAELAMAAEGNRASDQSADHKCGSHRTKEAFPSGLLFPVIWA